MMYTFANELRNEDSTLVETFDSTYAAFIAFMNHDGANFKPLSMDKLSASDLKKIKDLFGFKQWMI